MGCQTRDEDAREAQQAEARQREYFVEWTIEVSADSPEEAANIARAIQLQPDNTANHFYVTADDEDESTEINADLVPGDIL